MTARLPLFDLPQRRELESVEASREALAARVKELPINSHKRVILQDRLRQLTLQALRIETDLETDQ